MTATEQQSPLYAQLDGDLGSISIRRVVFPPLQSARNTSTSEPVDLDDDEPPLDLDEKKPINSYLEKPKRGQKCCVFLVNGQRQDSWDNQFISRDLGFKYLRNRMIVVVEVDGLRPEALGRLMKVDRDGFAQNQVYDALTKRVIATLKGDPELKRLEEEAEAQVAELQAGDEAVRSALDQLIEHHHEAASRTAHGTKLHGAQTRDTGVSGGLDQSISVVVEGTEGEEATGPVIVPVPDQATIRLKPKVSKLLSFTSRPLDDWSKIDRDAVAVVIQPPVDDLVVGYEVTNTGMVIDLTYDEPDDLPNDEYPIKTALKVLASFQDENDPRVCERPLIINKPQKRGPTKPKQPPVLLDVPTQLRVTSRQPVPITVSGSDVHVRMKWNGCDSLITGTTASWRVSGRCTSGHPFAPLAFSRPQDGKFEALIQVPDDLRPEQQIRFEVTASGPDEAALSVAFEAVAIEAAAPRKVTQKLPGGSERRPPYDLKVISQKDWDMPTCWGGLGWSGNDPGCYQVPSENQPLTIFINQDADVWSEFRDSMVSGPHKKAERTIEERKTKYISHVAFHLWQMFDQRQRLEEAADGTVPSDAVMQLEIRRVAQTMVQLMSVGR